MSLRMLTIYRILPLLMCLSVWSAAAQDPAQHADRLADMARINSLLQQDRRAEALPLCRQYVAENPDDAAMQYNLACLENTTGES